MKNVKGTIIFSCIAMIALALLQGQVPRTPLRKGTFSSKPDLVAEILQPVNSRYETRIRIVNKGRAFIGKCRIYLILDRHLPKRQRRVIEDCSFTASQLPYDNGIYLMPGLTNGAHTLTLYADYGDAINESNENNNIKEISFVVNEPKPDLVFYKARVPSRDKISFRLKNIGGFISQSFRVGLMLDGDRTRVKKYNMSWRTEDYSVFYDFIVSPHDAFQNISPGLHSVRVMLDVENRINESNENNNIGTVSFFKN